MKCDKYLGNVWWNEKCAEAVKEKKEHFKKYLKTRSPEDHTNMKLFKIKCNRVIAQAKNNFGLPFAKMKFIVIKICQKFG